MKPLSEIYSTLIDGKTESVGCTIGIYSKIDMEKQSVIECIFNEIGGKNWNSIYVQGPPCSGCDKVIEICSEEYKGLCEHIYMLGPHFIQNRTDTINNQNEIIAGLNNHFYLVYTFVFILVIAHVGLFIFYRYR